MAEDRIEGLRRRLAEVEAENARLRGDGTAAGTARDAARIVEEITGTDDGTDPFAAAVRATRMPMVISNPRLPDNPIVFVNDAFCRLCGYARDEIVGRNCRFLQGPDTDRAAVARIRAAVDAAQTVKIDILNYRRSGETFWNRLLMAPVRDAQGVLAYFFASQVDVTIERERLKGLENHNAALMAEVASQLHAQQDSEARLRFATEAGRLGIWELDLVTGELGASAVCKDHFGRGAAEPFTQDDLRAASHADDRDRVQRAIDRAILTDAEFDIEFRIVRPDGHEVWIALRAQVVKGLNGRPLRMAGISFDTTERRTAELRLALSEESLRLSNEAAEIGTWDLDLTMDVLQWSDRTKAMFGISPDVPCSMDDFYAGLHPDDRAHAGAAFAAAIDPDRRAVYDVEYRTVGKEDGLVRWVAAKGRGLFHDDGRCVRAIGTTIDITERKRAEERQLALLRLGDALRDLEDPAEMAFAAAEVLGTTLRASRAGYGLYEAESDLFVVERDWNAPGIASVAGRYRLGDFGIAVDQLARGEPMAVADAAANPRTRNHAEALAGLSARALVNMPVLEGGRLVALFFITQRDARKWSATEIDFLRDVADRTRAAVERRRAEAELRTLNATLERKVEERTRERDRVWRNAQDMIVVVDAQGTFLEVNPAVAKVLGWTPEDMIERPVFDFIVEEDLPSAEAALEHAKREELPTYVNRYRHKDGSIRWIAWVATPEDDLIYAYGRDVSAEREQAEALERSRAGLRAIFETRHTLKGLLDVQGRLMDANGVALEVIEAKLPDVVGRLFWETPWFTATPGMPEAVRDGIAAAAQGRSVQQEISVNVAAGLRSYDLSLSPIIDRHGKVIALVPEAVDITERRQAEEQLRQAQKMEAVGQLTGGLAHDFNNLLTGISGSLDLLGARVAQGRINDLERYIIAAQGASKRAAALTHRLLAFSRRQTLDPKPTDVAKLVVDMADLIRRTVGPEITVETVNMTGLWIALVDPNQLENALLNLCINARDAMPDGGRITIETGNKWMDDRAARQRDVEPGQYLSLCVSDTGTGMPPDVIARAFDPFFTTKPLGQGTGLGLSMIYGFARQSGGQVQIYSEIGDGTMICIYLPRHYGADDAADVAAAPTDAARAEDGEAVLVVDDEPTVRMLVGDVLEDLGYAAIEAEDGPSGLKVLRGGARIDLLVTDVGLPGGMNGRQMADAARVLRPGLKVLFITGYAENAVVGNGHLDPGMAVLTKPFAMDDLARKIRELIAK